MYMQIKKKTSSTVYCFQSAYFLNSGKHCYAKHFFDKIRLQQIYLIVLKEKFGKMFGNVEINMCDGLPVSEVNEMVNIWQKVHEKYEN